MEVRVEEQLSADQLAQLRRLERRTVAVDGGRLKLEWGALEAGGLAGAVVACEGDEMIGYIGRYPFGGGVTEVAGMVAPDVRKRGIGSTLLTEVLAFGRARGENRALLIVPRQSSGGAALATKSGGTLDHSEHALLMSAPPPEEPDDLSIEMQPMTAEQWADVRALLAEAFGYAPDGPRDDSDAATLVVRRGDRIIATLRRHLHGERGAVYGFAVAADLRGQGIGRHVLRRTCRELFGAGATAVGLEVAVDNEHALGLYTSLGFRPVTTEDYYLLTT